MQVQQIMQTAIRFADPNMTIRDAARSMRADNIGALPVAEDGRLLGMVTDRDIVTRAVAEELSPSDTSVREVMSQGLCYCYDDDALDEAAEVMAEHQVRRLPVINHDKQLVGFISLADLGRAEDYAAQEALKGVSEPTEKERR